jgi:hypothetical protein
MITKIWFNGMDLIGLGLLALCALAMLVYWGIYSVQEWMKKRRAK